MMRIGFIGGGAMGEALVSAFLKVNAVAAADVIVSDVAEARRQQLSTEYGVATTGDNTEAVKGADIVVLAVKPQEFLNVAEPLQGKLAENQECT